MGIRLIRQRLKYRENVEDPWKSLILQGDVDNNSVSYQLDQRNTKTSEEKSRARKNIGLDFTANEDSSITFDSPISASGISVDSSGTRLSSWISGAVTYTLTEAGGTDYYNAAKKYDDGTVECWGWKDVPVSTSSVNSATVNLLVSFAGANGIILANVSNAAVNDNMAYVGSTFFSGPSTATIYFYTTFAGTVHVSYHAIGRWES